MAENAVTESECRVGGWSGIAAIICYFGAAVLPLPDVVGRLLGLTFGPLFVISFIGIRAALKPDGNGLPLQIGTLFGVIAGAVVTMLLTIQIGNQLWLEQTLADLPGTEAAAAAHLVWEAVNRVQALLDVAWDIFLSVGAILIGISMFSSIDFGRVWGSLGVLLSALLLALNLYTYPRGPAYVGLVDVGPLLAIWFGAVYFRVAMIGSRSAG